MRRSRDSKRGQNLSPVEISSTFSEGGILQTSTPAVAQGKQSLRSVLGGQRRAAADPENREGEKQGGNRGPEPSRRG